MGTIREKLAYLSNTKALIRNAIIDKGVAVSTSDTFRSYAEKIGLIQGGSGSGSSMNLGPYAEPTMDYTFSNNAGSLPTFSTERPVLPQYTWNPDWWNIEEIIDADGEDYPAKMIVLYPAESSTISLTGANFYRVSDGTTYTANGTHTWDTSFDKVNSEGVGYRYVIYYYSSANGYSSSSVQSGALAIITKGFKWTNSAVFSNRRRLEYIKTKDSDWSNCTSTSSWCYDCQDLVYASFDFNNGNSIKEPIENMSQMFYQCYALTYIDFSFPAYANYFYNMFYYCNNLNNVHYDFSYRDMGACTPEFDRIWEGAGPNGNIILSLNPNQNMNTYRPWIGIKTDHPLKMSSVEWTNYYDGSSTYDAYYTPSTIDIEASNDNVSWEVVGIIEISDSRQNKTTVTELNLEDSYQYWRFRSAPISQFACNFIKLNAKWEKTTLAEDGTETKEWVDWTQPTFSSNVQDDCILSASSVNADSSSYDVYKAFQGKGSSGSYWESKSHNSRTGDSGLRCFSLRKMSYNQNTSYVANIMYIEGTDSSTGFYAPGLLARYVIFENTDNFTSMNAAFDTGYGSINSAILGCIIPNVTNITDWNYAFRGCSSMTVAPQIKFNADATVYWMFKDTGITDFSFLDYSVLKNATGLLSGTKITQANMEFPEAIVLDALFEYCTSLVRANVVAPKARGCAYLCNNSTRSSISSDYRNFLNRGASNSLKYIKVSGYNQADRATVIDKWTRPNLSSNTSYGTVSTTGLTAYNSNYSFPWFIYNGSTSTYYGQNWYQNTNQYIFRGTGSIVWVLPEGVEPTIKGLTFMSGFVLSSPSSTFKCRLYADTDKTIPLTDEFTVNGSIYRDKHTFTLATPVKTGTIVIDIIENPNNASIMDVSFDAEIEASGYMTNMDHAFYGSEVVHVDMDTSKVTNMSYMCAYAPNILDVSDFDFSSATNMDHAFYFNPSLTELNKVTFPKATNLNYAFANCWGLAEVTEFSAPECTTASYMFSQCTSLGAVLQPDMPKVTNLIRAFEQCDFLKDLDLSNIDNEVACDYICYQDYALAKVKLPSRPTNLQYAFQDCYALRQANLGNTSKVTSMLYAFEECRKLISVSSLDLSACTNMNYMFKNCYWLENIDITNLDSIVGPDQWNSSYDGINYNYYRTYNWFENCRSLVSVTLPAMPKVQALESIFAGCSSLTDVTVGATPACKSFAYFCQNCSSLTSVTFADTSKAQRMDHMFEGCASLEVQPEMSMVSAKTVEALFNVCNLKSVNLELPQVTKAHYLCCNNANLANVSITFGQKITNAEHMFYRCRSLTDLSFADNWDMSNCANLAYMFNGCEGLTSITLDKWTLKSDSNLDRIVASNKNLVGFTLDFKGVSHSGNKSSMAADCPKLESFNMVNPGNLSNFYGLYYNTYFKTITLNIGDYCSSCPNMYQIFESCPNLESVILNFSGRYLDRQAGNSDSSSYQWLGRMFAYSPKLKRIDILNADNIHSWNAAFRYMNNTEDCVVDWNNSRVPYNSIWSRTFQDKSNANLKHVNMLTSEDYPGYRAFNASQTEGFVAEPMLQEAQVDLKLPIDIQINKLTFTQRAGSNNVSDANGNEYDFPTTARFYSDKECQNPISAAMTLEPTASSVAEVAVADVVTNSITCKFGRDLGRYLGVGQIGISAKAKGYESWSTWTRPNLSSNSSYGAVSCGSYYSDCQPYKAFDGTISNTWQGWYANGTTSWLKWQLPKTIKIKSLKVVSCYYSSSSYYQFQGRFYTSSDKTVPMGDAFSFDSWNQTKTIANIPEEGIITDCIYLDKTGGGYYSGVQEIYIEADEQTYEWHPWSTPEETWTEQDKWKQPTPTANDSDGTFSASTETTDHEAYRITTSDGWQATAEDTDAYVQWVLPNTVHSSEISFASDTVASCQLYSDEGTTALGEPLEQTVTATNFANNVFIYPNNKVVVPDTATKLECIFRVNFSSVTDSGTLLWAASDTGFFIYSTHLSFWKDARYEGDVALSANKWYWVKATWTESNVSTKILEDNGYTYNTLPEDSAWTPDLVTTNTNVSHMVNSVLWVGGRESTNAGADQYLRGIIDLTNSRIFVDDEIWWDPTQANSYTINGDVTISHSGFICYDAADISTLRIKPLTKFDDSAVASFKNLNIEATYDLQKSNVIDFVMPSLNAYFQNGYEVTCSQPQRARYATSDSSYYSWYTYEYQYQPIIDFPPIIGCLAELYYMYLLDLNTKTSVQPKVFKNLDFFATTINNPSWVSDNNWWKNSSPSSYQRVMPMSFQNPRNICTSINLSQFSGLNHDSLIELLRALVSRKGISAATLTIGSQNLAKLTDEEKAIATEKNWNLA